ncbi:MAG TPA: hypothetical protein PKE25_05015, partial [Novosphingobium sp.]|nr:hypothetical protein [Novosphingobium sp.]
RPIPGCAFHPRCPYPKTGRPEGERPPLEEIEPGHCWSACGFCDSSAPIESVLARADEVADDGLPQDAGAPA